MSFKVLFISDNSLTHPILQAQGIPQILLNASEGTRFALMTFEKGSRDDAEYRSVREELSNRGIIHAPVYMPRSLFPSGRLWVWSLGLIMGLRTWFSFKPDIIHARSYPPMFIALFLKGLFGAKVLFDARGAYVDEIVEAGIVQRGSFIYRIERALEKKYLLHADVIVTVSTGHRDYVTDLTKSYRHTVRVVIIPNSTNLKKFESVKPLEGSSEVRLLYSGQHVDKYDMDKVFDFFIDLQSKRPQSSLRIVTYGPRETLLRKVETLPTALQTWVEILNAASEEMPAKMNAMSAGLLFLIPSLGNRVSAPIKLAEYLAAGLPIVVSEDVGDSRKIIEKYDVGVVVKKGDLANGVDRLLNLLDSTGLATRCRSAVMQELNIGDSAKKYLDLYKQMAV